MNTSALRTIGTAALLALAVWASPAKADEAVLAEFYGSGVHAYFSGNYNQAYRDLTTAIDGGTQDPRAYYFRAMTLMKLRRQSEAQSDLHKGAQLESADVNQIYPVSKSIERIQGSARLTLERNRAVARIESRQRQERRGAERYEEQRRIENEVLRRSIVPPAGFVPPPADGGPAPIAAPSGQPKPDAPLAPIEKPEVKPAVKPEVEPGDEPTDPFSTPDAAPAKDAKPADESKPADPFKDEPAKAEEKTPATTDTPAATDEPKKDEKAGDADDDPFGGG